MYIYMYIYIFIYIYLYTYTLTYIYYASNNPLEIAAWKKEVSVLLRELATLGTYRDIYAYIYV